MEQSKKNYYSLLLNKTFGNARKTWNVIKDITGVGIVKSDNLPKRLQRDDNRGDAFVNKEIAETFNSFFINIGKKLAGAIPEGKKSFKFFLQKSDSFMEESELLIDELRLAISMLKTNKSAGLDEVNPDVVKAVSDIIEKPLFKIFNLSLKNGIFPDQLKLAKIIPIYKGGDDSIKSNYRPISILSCFSKILERIMHNRLYNYLEKNNILYHKQFGFRNNHSTEHAVIDLANQILNGFDNDSYTLGIFLDLSKAFDTVNHKILIYKLHNYGVLNAFKGVLKRSTCFPLLATSGQSKRYEKRTPISELLCSQVVQQCNQREVAGYNIKKIHKQLSMLSIPAHDLDKAEVAVVDIDAESLISDGFQ
ncbi:uncharacterized protein LOC136091789 [Hydra vulgaris]|uniref:Uncharacterized protein LOC136091789 n=1 Tax=Hydra vulgaris TaxID=6087 RepID=A0ABM4DLZ3_HYDVU